MGGGLLLQFFMLYEHRIYGGAPVTILYALRAWELWGTPVTILYALRAWDLWGGSCYNSLCSTSIGIGGGDSL